MSGKVKVTRAQRDALLAAEAKQQRMAPTVELRPPEIVECASTIPGYISRSITRFHIDRNGREYKSHEFVEVKARGT